MLHRRAVIVNLVELLVNFIQVDIYFIKTGSRVKQFQPYRQRLREALMKPAFIVMHYLETFRTGLVESGPHATESLSPSSIASYYPANVIVPTYQFHRLMMAALRQRLRPPSYAGTLERVVRGWHREPATNEELATLLLFGGVEQVYRIVKIKTYADRMKELRHFFEVEPEDVALPHLDQNLAFRRDYAVKPRDVALPHLDQILERPLYSRIEEDELSTENVRDFMSPFKWISDLIADPDHMDSLSATALNGQPFEEEST